MATGVGESVYFIASMSTENDIGRTDSHYWLDWAISQQEIVWHKHIRLERCYNQRGGNHSSTQSE